MAPARAVNPQLFLYLDIWLIHATHLEKKEEKCTIILNLMQE